MTSTILVFMVAIFVSALTGATVLRVGLGEAADSDHSRLRDLSDWEWSRVGSQRSKEKG
jgi:hypothetical protein